jgi:hypothetical protein
LTSKAITGGEEEKWRSMAASLVEAVFLLVFDIIELDSGLIFEAIAYSLTVLDILTREE